jgi:hypothetical protein
VTEYQATNDGRYCVFILDTASGVADSLFTKDLDSPGAAVDRSGGYLQVLSFRLNPAQDIIGWKRFYSFTEINLTMSYVDGRPTNWLPHVDPASMEYWFAPDGQQYVLARPWAYFAPLASGGTTLREGIVFSGGVLPIRPSYNLNTHIGPPEVDPGLERSGAPVVPDISPWAATTPPGEVPSLAKSDSTAGPGLLFGHVDLRNVQFSPDSVWFVYAPFVDGARHVISYDCNGLFSVRLGTHIAANKLVEGLDSPDLLKQVEVSPDSLSVVYRRLDAAGVVRLYVVPIDGSGAPMGLSGALTPGGNVEEFHLTADSQYAVYRADAETDGLFALYRVALAGGEPPVALSGGETTGSGVLAIALTPSGHDAVYQGELGATGGVGLFSVPVDGGAAPVRLNPAAVAGSQLSRMAVGALGDRVVYLADESALNTMELFSVPVDGSTAPTKLSGPMAAGGNVLEFALSHDGLRASYEAGAPGAYALYSARLDGTERVKRSGDGHDPDGPGQWGGERLLYMDTADPNPKLYASSLVEVEPCSIRYSVESCAMDISIDGEVNPAQPHLVNCDTAVTMEAISNGDCTFLYWQVSGSPYVDNPWTFVPSELSLGEDIQVEAVSYGEPLTFARQPESARLYLGQSHTLSVDVTGGIGPRQFIWHKDGEITGGNGSTVLITAATPADAGVYTCVVTDLTDAPITSDDAIIEVFARASTGFHHADTNRDWLISIHELLRVIQIFNVGEYHCLAGTEDGFAPGPGDESCAAHHGDYNPQDWEFSLSEILRIVQYFNSPGGAYHANPATEDGYAPGAG